MEYWEPTEDRASKTLPVWQTHFATLTVNGVAPEAYATLASQFEAKAQLRAAAQDVYDDSVRAARTTLLKMKIVGTKVPQIIDGQLGTNKDIAGGLAKVFRVSPRTESTIRTRARDLFPVWVKANGLLAAMTPPLPPITRPLQGVAQTAAMLDAMEDGFPGQQDDTQAKEELLVTARNNLRELDRTVDVLSKNFYQIARSLVDPGSAAWIALDGIPAEGGGSAPDSIEIDQLVQGGDDGLHVLLSYESGGGDGATTKEAEYMIVGVDADFAHAVTLDASGNAFGPFTVGQVVKVRTKVSNSSGVRTSAVRTITIETPL